MESDLGVYTVKDLKESLRLAETLAKMSVSVRRKADMNNNNNDDNNGVYVPPKHLLLYLVRMGSFQSTPRYINADAQDDSLILDPKTTFENLKLMYRKELEGRPPLIERKFVSVCNSSGTKDKNSFRILQWNILAQALGEYTDRFVLCPPEAMEWNFRRFRILEGILEYDPDIVVMQEVDHFNFFAKTMSTQGYDGYFFPKPDSPCVYVKGNNGPDGCAIFYRKSKFELIKTATRTVEVWHVQSNQVLILQVLRHIATGREICVATTHLKAKQGALLSNLRNEQGKDILAFLTDEFSNRPIIIAGDFNAEPCEPVYTTMRTHPRMQLDSAYAKLTNNNSEPDYTTWKVREEGEIRHTIDYIFYSTSNLDVEMVLEIPDEEKIGQDRLPSMSYPSDHLSLAADFKFL
ncbi:nocturnin-like isoform X2 [Artemia franciscana]